MFEPQAIERTALRASADDLAAMQACLHASEAARNVAEFERCDGAFHARIVAAARNELLSVLYGAVNRVREQAEWGRLKERSLTAERRQAYEAQHREILDALRDRDGARARAALEAHLMLVRRNLLGD